jgi:hypothetical protein
MNADLLLVLGQAISSQPLSDVGADTSESASPTLNSAVDAHFAELGDDALAADRAELVAL